MFSSLDQLNTEKNTVLKKRVCLVDGTHYMITCKTIWTREEKSFQLQLNAINTDNTVNLGTVESELQLSYEDLLKVLNHVESRDILPIMLDDSQIKSMYALVKYKLMPITMAAALDNGKKEIAIHPMPPNLLETKIDSVPTIEFMGEQCVVIIAHVFENTFRAILIESDSLDQKIRIDLEFDEISFNKYFQRYGGIQSDRSSEKKEDSEELESIQVVSECFAEHLTKALKAAETFLTCDGTNDFKQLCDERELKFVKLKINGYNREAHLVCVWDHPDKQTTQIKARSFGDIFTQDKEASVLNKLDYQHSVVWESYGLIFSRLNYADKIVMCNKILDEHYSNTNFKDSNKRKEPESTEASVQIKDVVYDEADKSNIFSEKKMTEDNSRMAGDEKAGANSDTDRSNSAVGGLKRNSISIPTSIDYIDSPSGAHNSNGDLKMPKYAVIKKRVFLDDGIQYVLTCKVSWTKDEKIFKLQLNSVDANNVVDLNTIESELELPYKDLRKILKHVEYKDVMPVTFHIKQIKNFYTLVRYLLMPFTTVRTLEDGKKEIAIYPKPPNLLTNSINDMPTIEFMGSQCVIILTHVIRNTFRIILTDPENVEEALRIDIEFDKLSFDQCFQRHGGVDAQLRTSETTMKIIQGYDEDVDPDEIVDFKETIKKLTNPERVDEEELESFKVIPKDFAEDLGNILKEMETFLNSNGIKSFSQLSDDKELKYCKLKVVGKAKKTTLHFIWDRPDKQIIEVKVQNFYETFAPNKKVKAFGKFDYLYDTVWKDFGLIYTNLENLDKTAICSMVADIYHLDVFDKEISREDFDRYEENAISFVPLEIGAYHRTFIGEKFKFPLTLSLVGLKGEPKGIKATIYNLQDAIEVGVFFYINPESWAVKESEKKKKRSEKIATLTLVENYHLDRVLKRGGWDLLKNWLVMDKQQNRVDIVGIETSKEIRSMEQIENILDSDSIFKYLSEKEDAEG